LNRKTNPKYEVKPFLGLSYEKANIIYKRLLVFFHHELEYSNDMFLTEWEKVDIEGSGFVDNI